MKQEKQILQEFLRDRIYDYRVRHQLSQERLAEKLHISTRAYVEQEHGKIGFSALSVMHFMMLLNERETAEFLEGVRKLLERSRRDDAKGDV